MFTNHNFQSVIFSLAGLVISACLIYILHDGADKRRLLNEQCRISGGTVVYGLALDGRRDWLCIREYKVIE